VPLLLLLLVFVQRECVRRWLRLLLLLLLLLRLVFAQRACLILRCLILRWLLLLLRGRLRRPWRVHDIRLSLMWKLLRVRLLVAKRLRKRLLCKR